MFEGRRVFEGSRVFERKGEELVTRGDDKREGEELVTRGDDEREAGDGGGLGDLAAGRGAGLIPDLILVELGPVVPGSKRACCGERAGG